MLTETPKNDRLLSDGSKPPSIPNWVWIALFFAFSTFMGLYCPSLHTLPNSSLNSGATEQVDKQTLQRPGAATVFAVPSLLAAPGQQTMERYLHIEHDA